MAKWQLHLEEVGASKEDSSLLNGEGGGRGRVEVEVEVEVEGGRLEARRACRQGGSSEHCRHRGRARIGRL